MKKFLAFLLALTMVFSILPFALIGVVADDEVVEDEIVEEEVIGEEVLYFSADGVDYYLSDDGTYYYVYSIRESGENVVIYPEILGIPVKAIETVFGYRDQLKSVVIPDSIVTISDKNFMSCDNLTDIYCLSKSIPETWASTWNCYTDAKVHWGYEYVYELPKAVSYHNIDYRLSDDQSYYYVDGCRTDRADITLLSEIFGIPVTAIDEYAFHLCDHLVSIVIPDSITTIEKSAFYRSKNLKSVVLSNSLTVLEGFAGCESLTSIVIPDSVTTVDGFAGCTSLASIVFPDSVTTIGGFSECPSLTSIVIPDSVTTIMPMAFSRCSGLTSMVIPKSVINMGDCVFMMSENITDIYCEAASRPETWSEYWNYNLGDDEFPSSPISAKIHWGYKDPNEPDGSNPDGFNPDGSNPDGSNPDGTQQSLGDINGNNKIDMTDYILLKRAYFGTYNFTEPQKKFGDINKNGKIDMTDYILLKRAYFGTYTLVKK